MENAVTEHCFFKQDFNNSQISDRRTERVERRVNIHKTAVQAVYRRRRQKLRRESDNIRGVYVDTHEPRLLYLSMGLMLLSVIDAFFTTILISNGSSELNPLLDFLLKIDLSLFLAAKFLVTGLSISFLVLHKHHHLLNTVSCYHLLVACVVVYAVLIAYEWSMIRLLPILH